MFVVSVVLDCKREAINFRKFRFLLLSKCLHACWYFKWPKFVKGNAHSTTSPNLKLFLFSKTKKNLTFASIQYYRTFPQRSEGSFSLYICICIHFWSVSVLPSVSLYEFIWKTCSESQLWRFCLQICQRAFQSIPNRLVSKIDESSRRIRSQYTISRYHLCFWRRKA